MSSWGKLWTTRYKKTKNPTATSEEPGAKAGGRETAQGTAHYPLHSTPPKGRADHLSHASSPTPGHTPTLTPYKEPALPASGSEQAGEPVTGSRSPLLQQGP